VATSRAACGRSGASTSEASRSGAGSGRETHAVVDLVLHILCAILCRPGTLMYERPYSIAADLVTWCCILCL
jgi:hypothetical protein